MKKKVIVACSTTVITATLVTRKIEELCQKNAIDVSIIQARVSEINLKLPADLIITMVPVLKEYGIPKIDGTPLVTGNGEGKTKADILKILK